ncbi:hypothetical protein [Xanthomonas sp. MUS 060]|uniref:hypothetical protein n=1 Tax=Xanthomonas sp. MUS 060 TaxID=1588031 RepID=UPI0005F2FD29|nr:hypothetical protein [Xanthomonas sp. MUS 060]
MSKLHDSVARWERMQEITDAAHNHMRELLKPMVQALGCGEAREITQIRHSTKEIVVSYVNYWGGERNCWDVSIPKEVWDAEDPVSAAHKYREARSKEAGIAERQRKIEKIQQLTKELAAMQKLEEQEGCDEHGAE